MENPIQKYIRSRKRPVSSLEIARDVLKMSGGALDLVEKIIGDAVSDNDSIQRDVQGLWHWTGGRESRTAATSGQKTDLFSVFSISVCLVPGRGRIPVGIAAGKIRSGKIIDRFADSFHHEEIVIPGEFFSGTGMPVPETSGENNPGRVLDRFLDFIGNSYLVCYHFQPDYRLLLQLLNQHCFDPPENDVLSIRLLAEQLYNGHRFATRENLLDHLNMDRLETCQVPRELDTLAGIFQKISEELLERGVSNSVSMFDYQMQGTQPALDYDNLGFDESFFMSIPEYPGVYLMENRAGNVFYVGKAKNLSRRLKSHFLPNSPEPDKQKYILGELYTISYETTGSELEALLKEFHLIQTLKPSLNTQVDTHDRTLPVSVPEDFALVLPSVNSDEAELYIVLKHLQVRQIKISKHNPDFSPVSHVIKKFFRPRKDPPYLSDEDEMRKRIVMSWTAREWNNVRTVSLHETAGTNDVIRILKQHLETPEPLTEKIYIR